MCRSMVDIQSVAAEIRRGKKERQKKIERNHMAKIMAPLLHRAAIIRYDRINYIYVRPKADE